MLDFIHLVYSPRGIQYFNIQPVSSKLVYFLITIYSAIGLLFRLISHKVGISLPKAFCWDFRPISHKIEISLSIHIELEIYLRN